MPSTLVCGGAFLALAGTWAAAYSYTAGDHAQTVAAAEREQSNLALTLAESNSQDLQFIRHGLQSFARDLQAGGGRDASYSWADPRVVQRVVVADRQGWTTDESGRKVNIADRDYFQWHLRNPGVSLHVGAPVQGRVSPDAPWIIPASMRLPGPNGEFAGVLVAGLKPEYFADAYRGAELGEAGVTMLVGVDGVVRAERRRQVVGAGADRRTSTLLRLFAQNAAGSFRSGGAYDGVIRILSYRPVPGFPELVLAVGRAERDILADHDKRTQVVLAVATMASIAILLFAALAWIVVRRHRRFTARLARSEERLRGLYNEARASRYLADRLTQTLESLPAAFLTVDDEWTVSYANREARRVLARAGDEPVGTPLWLAMRALAGSPFEGGLRRAMASRTPAEFEAFHEPSGLWLEMRAFPAAGGGLAVYFHDITAPRRDRKRFVHAALATSDAIWEWSPETGRTWLSTGRAGLLDAGAADWEDMLHPEDRHRVMASFREAVAAGASRWSAHYRLRRREGGFGNVEDRASFMRTADGRAYGAVGLVSDITEPRELETPG